MNQGKSEEDPLESIREHEEVVKQLAERENRIGAIARYMLAVSQGEIPAPKDCEVANLPKLGSEGRK